jgi:F0F1-type ATP synthase membrane subunit b/b'
MMIIVSLIFFLMVIFFVMIVMFRRIITQNVVSATTHLEELNQDYAKKDEEISKRYEEVERQSKKLLADAQKEAEAQKGRIIREAEEKKESIVSQAQQKADEIVEKADSTRLGLITDIERKIDDKAVARAVELLQQVLPSGLCRQMHSLLFNEFMEADLEKLKNLNIPEGVHEARVISAFALEEGERVALSGKLKDKTQRDFTLHQEIQADLISGIVISIGHLVLDGSLKFMISRKAKELLVKAHEG